MFAYFFRGLFVEDYDLNILGSDKDYSDDDSDVDHSDNEGRHLELLRSMGEITQSKT